MLEGLLFFLLIFTPLAYGTVEVWSVTVMHSVSIALLAIWGFSLIRKDHPGIVLTKIDKYVLVFFTAFCISSVLSIYPYASRLQLYNFLNYAGIFYITINIFKERQKLAALVWVIMLFGGLYALTSLSITGQDFLGYRIFSPDRFSISFTFVNHNHFAGYLEMVSLLCIGSALGYTGKKRYLLAVFGIASSAAILLSLSRGGTISLLGGLLFLFFLIILSGRYKRGPLMAVLIFSAIVIFLALNGFEPVVERLMTLMDPAAAGKGRIEAWRGIAEMISERPWFGHGPGTFAYAFPPYKNERMSSTFFTHAHNDYLEMAAELGIVGLLSAITCISAIFITALKRLFCLNDKRLQMIGLGAASGCFSIMIHSVTDFNFSIPSNALLFSVLAAITLITASFQSPFRYSRIIKRFPSKTAYNILLVSLGLLSLAAVSSPLIGDILQKKAVTYRDSGQFTAAEKALKLAIYFDPGNAEHDAAAGDLLQSWPFGSDEQLGKADALSEALNYYKDAINKNPSRGYYFTKKAHILQKLGRFGEAEESLKTSDIVEPMSRLAFYNTGTLYLEQGKVSSAIPEFQKFFMLHGNLKYLIPVMEKLWDNQSSYDELKKIVPQYDDHRRRFAYFLLQKKRKDSAIIEFKTAFSINPSALNAGAHINGLNRTGRYTEALHAGEGYIERFGEKATLLKQLAVTYEKLGMTTMSIDAYKNIIQDNPDDIPSAISLSDIYMSLKESSNAVTVLNNALKNHPSDLGLNRHLASVYEKTKMYDQASSTLEDLIPLYKDSTYLHIMLGRVYMKSGMHLKSIEVLLNAGKIFPENRDIKKQLALTYASYGRYSETVDVYNSLISDYPDDVSSYISLAKTQLKHNDTSNALTTAKTAILLNPADPSLYNLLSDIYRRIKMPNEEINALKTASQLKPDDAALHYRLGIKYKSQGLYNNATLEWQKCLEIQPDNRKCRNILENNNIYR